MSQAAPAFSLTDPAFVRDPYPLLSDAARGRARLEVAAGRMGADPPRGHSARAPGQFLRSRFRRRDIRSAQPPRARRGAGVQVARPFHAAARPARYTRLRGLVAKAFTARRVEEMRPQIDRIVTALLDGIVPRGRMDVIEDFSFKLPVIVICDMLGIPEEDRGALPGARLIAFRAARSTPIR